MDADHTAEPGPGTEPPAPAVCYRHPDRESYVRCARCDRYACPECRREASVGYQCVDCVQQGNAGVRQPRSVFGGPVSAAPVATVALIVINVIAYVIELIRPEFVDRFEMVGQTVIGPDGNHYLVHSSALPPGFDGVGVAQGEWYRLISSAFLHLPLTNGAMSILHIVFNMYWLWILGRVVEHQLGTVRYLALYLACALGGSVSVYLLNSPAQSAVGASGAIFGLAGAYFVLSRRLHYDPLGGKQLLITFVVWMVVAAGFTSWQGHLGGLLTGLALGSVFAFAPRGRAGVQGTVQAAGTVALVGLLLVLVAVRTADITASMPWSA